MKDTSFPLFKGSEKHSRSFTYVGDIVKGVAAVVGREDLVDGEIINIGSNIEYTTQDGINLVEEIIGKKALIEVTPPRPGDQLRTTALIDKAQELLNYMPTTSFKEDSRPKLLGIRKNL